MTRGDPSVVNDPHTRPKMAAASARRAAAILAFVAVVAATGAAPAAMAAEAIHVSPGVLSPGAEVAVTATEFPPMAAVELGVGPPSSEYAVIDTGRTDGGGSITFMLKVSERAPVGAVVVFVVALEDLSAKAASPPLEIAAPEDIPTTDRLVGPGS